MTLFQAERSSKPHSEQILGFRFAGGTRHGRVALHCLSQVNSRGSEPRAHHRETHIVADADEWVWDGRVLKVGPRRLHRDPSDNSRSFSRIDSESP
jgi:hypothetical protein